MCGWKRLGTYYMTCSCMARLGQTNYVSHQSLSGFAFRQAVIIHYSLLTNSSKSMALTVEAVGLK